MAKRNRNILADQAGSNQISFSSVENIPGCDARAAFTVHSASVFKEEGEISPVTVSDRLSYMPWGGNNELPFDIIEKIEADETLATCQQFNSEVCYAAGLSYVCTSENPKTMDEIEEFFLDNNIPSYFLGVSMDFKFFGIAFSVIILNSDNSRIVRVIRKEACYCRFVPADKSGKIRKIIYANWRKSPAEKEMEVIELLDPDAPWSDLRERIRKSPDTHKYAVVSRIPTPDSTYYPIPYYAALFKGKWYDIKQLIGIAKEAKLRNSAPIKYHIEISSKYFDSIFRAEGISDRVKQVARVVREKQNILDFLTGAENSGKAWFSTFYVSPDGREQHDVMIHRIDDAKEGGDWATDIQEAVNMVCFTMRVHSNLVGSVPGKAQSNNSGSDKRELYTIAQSLQKPYRDILFRVHEIIIRFNAWRNTRPVCPLIQLTTLDEHRDAKQVSPPDPNPNQ